MKNKTTNSGDFSIGSNVWPGISKLVEECGEVLQICGKLVGTGGEPNHWDGSNLTERLQDEMADVIAAIWFVAKANELDEAAIQKRVYEKTRQFYRWQETPEPLEK